MSRLASIRMGAFTKEARLIQLNIVVVVVVVVVRGAGGGGGGGRLLDKRHSFDRELQLCHFR